MRSILVLAKQTVLDVPIFGRASSIASAALDILGGRTHWRISQKRGNADQIMLEVGSGKRQKAGLPPCFTWRFAVHQRGANELESLLLMPGKTGKLGGMRHLDLAY